MGKKQKFGDLPMPKPKHKTGYYARKYREAKVHYQPIGDFSPPCPKR